MMSDADSAAEQRETSAAQQAAAEASDRVQGDARAAAAEARMVGTGDVDEWMGLDTGQVRFAPYGIAYGIG